MICQIYRKLAAYIATRVVNKYNNKIQIGSIFVSGVIELQGAMVNNSR